MQILESEEYTSRKLDNNKMKPENNDNKKLNKEINVLNRTIVDLKEKLKIYPCDLEENENLMTVIINSVDQQILNCPMICKNTDKISDIEKRICEEFPAFSKTDNYFLCHRGIINKFETFENNKIKNGDSIILNQKTEQNEND